MVYHIINAAITGFSKKFQYESRNNGGKVIIFLYWLRILLYFPPWAEIYDLI